MSTTPSDVENATGIDQRTIDHDRVVRALTEEMLLTTHAPNMITVTHDDSEYTVDLVSGSCDGPDAQYNPETYCKHALKAALVTIYREGVTTPFVARVVQYFTEHPCPHGNDHICDGPTGPHLPCPACVTATTCDDYTVWEQTAGRTGARR